jgi:excisionase family DNA binding protein
VFYSGVIVQSEFSGKPQHTLVLRSLVMVIEDRWLSVEEICKYLGVSNDTVYKWIDKHGMPAHRMGRLWKFKKDEVDEWVKTGGADQVS